MTAFDGSTTLAVTTLGLALVVVLYVWLALGLAAVFQKSGEEAWRAWVPVLNLVILLRLGGLTGWLLLLGLIPFAGLLAVWVVVVIAAHRIGAAFGYGPGMTVLAAVLLPAWAGVIGFGSSRWVGDESHPAGHRGAVESFPAAAGARRSASDVEYEDGVAFLSTLSDSAPPSAGFDATTPPSAYGRRGATPADAPPLPPMPAAPPAGWVPPPLPMPAGAPAPAPAASALAVADLRPSPAHRPLRHPRQPSRHPRQPSGTRRRGIRSSADPAGAGGSGATRERFWEGLPDADEFTGEVTGAVSGAPAPISAVPVMRRGDAGEAAPGPMREPDRSPPATQPMPRLRSLACPPRRTRPRSSRGRRRDRR